MALVSLTRDSCRSAWPELLQHPSLEWDVSSKTPVRLAQALAESMAPRSPGGSPSAKDSWSFRACGEGGPFVKRLLAGFQATEEIRTWASAAGLSRQNLRGLPECVHEVKCHRCTGHGRWNMKAPLLAGTAPASSAAWGHDSSPSHPALRKHASLAARDS